MKITSDFALLDVKEGRTELANHLALHEGDRIPVVLIGYITGQWSPDDGISIEFEVKIEDLILEPRAVETKYTVTSSCAGPYPHPTFADEEVAIAEAQRERTIPSYLREGSFRSADVYRTTTITKQIPIPRP